MKSLFPRWSNTILRLVLVVLAGGAIGTVLFLMAFVRSPIALGKNTPVDQPIEFDHRHHVNDAGIDCRYCHYPVEQSAFAGVPPTEVCLNCHGQIWNEAPLIEPLRRSQDTGQPVEWNRVHNLPDFAFFNHASHVNAGVGCVECHGRVDRMARVYQEADLTMQWCLDCHRDPAPRLRPLDRITDTTWRPESPEVGQRLVEEHRINPPLNCSGCHR